MMMMMMTTYLQILDKLEQTGIGKCQKCHDIYRNQTNIKYWWNCYTIKIKKYL